MLSKMWSWIYIVYQKKKTCYEDRENKISFARHIDYNVVNTVRTVQQYYNKAADIAVVL